MLGLLLLVGIGALAVMTLPAWAAITAIAVGAAAPFLLVAGRSWFTHKPITWKSLGWAANQAPVTALGSLVVAAAASLLGGLALAEATAAKVAVGASTAAVLADTLRHSTIDEVDKALDEGTPVFKQGPTERASVDAPRPAEPGPAREKTFAPPSRTAGIVNALGG